MEIFNQIIILAICYAMLFLVCLWAWKMKSENLVSQKILNGNWILLHVRHGGGVFIMAGLPSLYLQSLPDHLLVWPKPVDYLKTLALIITAMMLLISVVKNKKGRPAGDFSILKGASFHPVLHILLRSSFLVSYEWFFRGCVLFSCIDLFGTSWAVLINLVLFALIHSFNGKKEMFGSVPFGLMLCLFTIWWQSVWPAILLHLLVSSAHESYFLSQFLGKKAKPVLRNFL